MKFKEFIGIDISKNHIDVFIGSSKVHDLFKNTNQGFEIMMGWITRHSVYSMNEILFAFEHTGLYSLNLSQFLHESKCAFAIISGLELKRSRGLVRGKSDKIDARAIAEFVYEKREKIKLYKMPSKALIKLKRLLSYRERLVKERAAYKMREKEYKLFLEKKDYNILFNSHMRMIKVFDDEIAAINNELYMLVKQDPTLKYQFDLINTIRGVGPQTAMVIIVLTNGFTLFEDWRKFASYAGTAPFPNTSGTFKGKSKISNLANKRIKTLLNCCAVSCLRYNPEMKIYFQRRTSEGKNKMSTINIIRNKLISRIFAVVKRGTPYVNTYSYAT